MRENVERTMLRTVFVCFLIVQSIGQNYGSHDLQWKIVGGLNIPSNATLYQASLRTNDHHFCGGSIISKRTILTAAHCLYGNNLKSLIVVVGTTTLSRGGDRYEANSYKIHDYYDPRNNYNDIAMIYLNDEIQMKENIELIAPGDDLLDANVSVFLSGWGMTSYPGHASNHLKIIKLKTLSNDECNSLLPNLYVNDGQICTLTRVGEGSCSGDSGGPLVANKKQVGIVSMGYPCAIGYPDIFTRISHYSTWIKENVK